MPRKKKNTSVLDGLFGEAAAVPAASASAKQVEETKVLAFLRDGPKHLNWLIVRVPSAAAVIERLRAAGHPVVHVIFHQFRVHGGVYCLVEDGRLCGVEGERGVYREPDPATLPKPAKGKK